MSKITQLELGDAIKDNMMVMSLEAVLNRALPMLEDGLKPSQRKILYTMHNMGLSNKKSKCANIDGQTMRILPHGSSYSTLVRMTEQAEVLLTPFIDGKGSFGKVYSDSMQPAAARYTEAGLLPICSEMFNTLHKHEMKDNYDGTMKEPVFLSMPYPNILANSQAGMGIGFACSFPSFNLGELCDAAIDVIEGKDCLLVPDFSTGASLLYDAQAIRQINTTGQGSFKLRAVIENNKTENVLEIKEIPYTTTAERVLADIQKAYDAGKLPEITDMIDEIGINGFKVTVFYKKNTDVEKLLAKLYKFTSLEDTFSANMTAVYKNKPVQLGVKDCVLNWFEHRKEWVTEEINYDIIKKKSDLMLLYALKSILLDIDKAVEIVKMSTSDKEVVEKLGKFFKLTDDQSEYVANIKLRNFNKEYITKKISEISKLEKEIDELSKLDITKFIINELKRIKTDYGKDRLTKIVNDWSTAEVPIEPQVSECLLYLNTHGLKKLPISSTAKNEGMRRYVCAGKEELIIFTSLGKIYKHKVASIPFGSINFTDLFKKNELSAAESILFVTVLNENNNIFIIYDNGTATKFSHKLLVTKGGKRCFSQGFLVKAVPVGIYDLSKDTVIDNIDTKNYETKKSRLAKPDKIKEK